jgi:hypothetical protein
MASKTRFLQPLLPGGWLLTGAGAAVLRPSALTLLVSVLQAVVLLVAVWAAAWRQARGQDRAQKLLEATGATPTSVVVDADGRIEIRYDGQHPGGAAAGEEPGERETG